LDFRDLWVGNHVYPGIWPFTLIERLVERFYVNRADMIVTVSDALANELRARYPQKKIVVSPNGFDPEEVASVPQLPANFRNEHFTIVYTGSLHEDQRNPAPLFEAIARLPSEVRLKIRVKFAGPIPAFIPPLVAKHGLHEVVRLLGKRPREESLRLQAEADVLLFLEQQHDESRDGVLTGKLFEYLVTGRPIWAVGVGPNSTVGKLLTEGHAGLALGTNTGLVSLALTEALDNGRLAARQVGSIGDLSSRFNRTEIANDLLEAIESLDRRIKRHQ
jgi:glycosyltransferase involved in cell wall biosynthesis